MASVSVSHMILFIASMLIAASVAGTFTETVGQISESIETQGRQVSDDIRTDIEIISDSGSNAVYNDPTITIHVKNTGSDRLRAETEVINVFVNGQFDTDVTVTLLENADTWGPGEVVRLEIDQSGLSGDVRVKVIVNGDEEVFEFRVT